MADRNDRDERRGAGVGLVMGLLVGTVFGLGLGMLLAPKSGSELRGQIGEQARNLRRRAVDQSRRAGEWAARGRHCAGLTEASKRSYGFEHEIASPMSGPTRISLRPPLASSSVQESRPRRFLIVPARPRLSLVAGETPIGN